jgi:ribonuclease P protein component
MLKRENRLLRIVRRAGDKKYFSPSFNLKISANNDNAVRFGFIVSKKIDKRAVVRNQTKRVLRSAVEKFITSLAGKDIVIIAKKNLLPKEKEEVVEELSKILK